jgi:hypothetical protein
VKLTTIAEALNFVGGLSNPSKMPCHSYGISAKLCDTGSKLVHIEGSTCSDCYALKGFYADWNKNIVRAHAKRVESIYKPEWVQAMVFIITKKKMTYFRWHDSGDLQSFQHLLDIVRIADRLPSVNFWLPTKEKKLIYQYRETFGDFPANLCVRLSGAMIDGKAPVYEGNTSTVVSTVAYTCKAPTQGNKCLDCRDCWDRNVKNVSYRVH